MVKPISVSACGAYVGTPVVAMYAPIVGSSTCHSATIKAHGMQIVAWYTPTTPRGAYMPTTTVGTYAPPVQVCAASGIDGIDNLSLASSPSCGRTVCRIL